MPESQARKVHSQIAIIEVELTILGLISHKQPSAEAMASTVPFAYDQMLFTEWLQWILIPKTRLLIENQLPMPANCGIHPLAEEEFKDLPQQTDTLLAHIKELDDLFDNKADNQTGEH